jgi:hypothetical protein
MYSKAWRGIAILPGRVLCHFSHIFGLVVQFVSVIVSLYSLFVCAHTNVLLKKLITTQIQHFMNKRLGNRGIRGSDAQN